MTQEKWDEYITKRKGLKLSTLKSHLQNFRALIRHHGLSLGAPLIPNFDHVVVPKDQRSRRKETITEDFYMTPEDFRDDYLSVHGAGFSVAPIFRQSAWFRFHNRAEGVENLYLVGAGTHPGAGMPGVLCSAKVVDRLVAEAEVHAPC